MYCPSCDKTYGAVHSRCPECHSWLKVSAPSGSRSKGSKSGSFGSNEADQGSVGGSVSTVSRDSDTGIAWADPAPTDSHGPAWSAGSASSAWSDDDLDVPVDSAKSGPANGWAGSSSSSGGWDVQSKPAATSAWGSDDAAAPPAAAAPKAAPASSGTGWLAAAGGPESDDWDGGGLASSPPVTTTPKPQSNGWLADGPASSPSPAAKKDDYSDGWQVGGSDPAPGSGRGWLADGPGDSAPESGRGWLVDGGSTTGPSMTEMVDQAIHGETDDDFVDDSWVDEEIRDSEFDELEVPEYVGASPESGGAVLKMLLVAVMAVLLVGGFMFMNKDHKPTKEDEAAQLANKSQEIKNTIADLKSEVANGRGALAVDGLKQAIKDLKSINGDSRQVADTEVLLGKALTQAGDLEEAVDHWRTLKSNPDKTVSKAALEGIATASRELRKDANETLKEAKSLVAKGEVNAVLPRARDALEIYKNYGGNSAQQGDAHGVMGRAYLNGLDYGNAQDHLRTAVKMAPGAGYERYLSEANSRIQPTYYPQQTYVPASRPTTRVKPSFDLGGNGGYQTSNHRGGGGRRSSSNSNSGGGETSAPAPAPRRMQELPVARPSTSRPSSSGSRFSKSKQGNLQSY